MPRKKVKAAAIAVSAIKPRTRSKTTAKPDAINLVADVADKDDDAAVPINQPEFVADSGDDVELPFKPLPKHAPYPCKANPAIIMWGGVAGEVPKKAPLKKAPAKRKGKAPVAAAIVCACCGNVIPNGTPLYEYKGESWCRAPKCFKHIMARVRGIKQVPKSAPKPALRSASKAAPVVPPVKAPLLPAKPATKLALKQDIKSAIVQATKAQTQVTKISAVKPAAKRAARA